MVGFRWRYRGAVLGSQNAAQGLAGDTQRKRFDGDDLTNLLVAGGKSLVDPLPDLFGAAFDASSSRTAATGASPHFGSSTPKTATSRTAACWITTSSMSCG